MPSTRSSPTSFNPPFPDSGTPARPPQRQSFRRAQSPFVKPLRPVPPSGPLPARVYLIGEKPGREESERGLPFVGISGKYLSIFMDAANVNRADCRINNLVSTFTEYSKPTREEMDRDHDALVEDILACDPDVIGLVGGYAVAEVLKCAPEMDKRHGVARHVDALFGGEVSRDRGWMCLPILHPANCIHSPESMPNVLDDFLTLGKLLDGEMGVLGDDPYAGREDYRPVTVNDLSSLLPERHGIMVAIDTEGWAANPWSLQFSVKAGTGYVIRATDTEALGYFNAWLRRVEAVVVGHNLLHDYAVARALGVELGDSPVDTMIRAYNLTIEPQSLKSLAYRHCNAHQDEYSDITHDASQDRAMDYLYEVLSHEWPTVEPMLVYEGGKPRVKKPWNIDRRVSKIITDVIGGKVDKDGNPTDPRKRWKEIDDFVREPVEEVLGPMTIATLDDIDMGVAVRYAARDSDINLRIAPPLGDKIREMGLEEISQIDHAVIPMLERMQTVGMKLAGREFWDQLELKCEAQEERAKWAIYKETGWDLNPGSGDQVAALLYGPTKEQLIQKGVPAVEIVNAGLGLVPPKMTDGGKTGKVRGSTNDKCLENLLPLSPVVEHVMDYRQANKVKGTYVRPLRRLALSGDGRAHPGIKPTRVSSGRLATADPNLLAIPVHWGVGTEVRGGFVADDGYVLYDADLSQAEMRGMAHDSKDEKLCKVFWDGDDVHTMTACEMFSTSPGNVESWQRYAAKQTGFGIINLISEYGLYDQMILYRATKKDGSRWTIDDCAMMIETWFGIYKGVKRFHNDVIDEARATGLSRESIGGRIRYVPGVWSPIGKIRGDSEREACSHRIQSMAQSFMKKAMALMWPILRDMPGVEVLLQIHDEILISVPDDPDTRGQVDSVVVWAMENAHKLRVPMLAEGGFGNSWMSAKH